MPPVRLSPLRVLPVTEPFLPHHRVHFLQLPQCTSFEEKLNRIDHKKIIRLLRTKLQTQHLIDPRVARLSSSLVSLLHLNVSHVERSRVLLL